MIGIYKIVSPSSRIYIGQSINLDKRKQNYGYMKCMGQKRLLCSIRKYGWKEHIFTIIEECSIKELNNRERYWQDFYNVLGIKGLNCKLTECDGKSGKLSEKTKDIIRQSLLGKPHSKERRLNESIAQLGKKQPASQRNKISKGNLENYLRNPNRSKDNMADKRKVVTQFSRQGDIIREYISTREAERVTGIDSGTISRCCNGKRHSKTAGGFIWKYL